METDELKRLIEKAIVLMKKKQKVKKESIIDIFIKDYENIREQLINKNDDESIDFSKIRFCTRRYMETSSNYRQDFLDVLGTVEKHISKRVM